MEEAKKWFKAIITSALYVALVAFLIYAAIAYDVNLSIEMVYTILGILAFVCFTFWFRYYLFE